MPNDSTVTGLVRRRRPPPSLDDGEVPRTIGRFVITERLGAGGMGVVYSAFDPRLQRVVAVKLLRVGRAHDGVDAQRLIQEARAMARLSHPNVLPVFEVDSHDDRVFVAMELVKGRTLRAWLDAEERSWSAILDAFEQAGRGLEAAHTEGLVHRDFKPDNVMVGEDGRIRVMDFGLVHVVGADETPSSEGVSEAPVRMTATGGILGTPAYMAPEQYAGDRVDARSDQFSFCVAVWEAVYGTRPFQGDSAPELASAVIEGRLHRARPRRRVPQWLRRVLRRGLSVDPEDRFPSMQALLAALAHGRRRRRATIWLGGAAASVLAIASVAGYERWQAHAKTAHCEQIAIDEMASVWNDDTEQRLREGLIATGVSTAEVSAERAVAVLDRHAEDLRRARTDACLATDVTGEYDQDTSDRALWCLDLRQIQFDALVETLADADVATLHRAVQVAAALPDLRLCRDPERLRRVPAPPSDGRDAVREVSQRIWTARAMSRAARHEQSTVAAKEALARAEALGSLPLIASAELVLASALSSAGSPEEAEKAAERAYFAATRAGDPNIQAEAAFELIKIVGHELRRPADGQRWGELSEIALEELGVGEDELQRAYHLGAMALLAQDAADLDGALAMQERVLAIKRAELPSDHPALALTLTNIAIVHASLGDARTAATIFRESLAIEEAAFGPDHPSVANTLDNLAIAVKRDGDLAQAAELQARALAIREAVLPPNHPDIATSLVNVAAMRHRLGDEEAAVALWTRALAIREEAYGQSHPEVAAVVANLTEVFLDLERYDEAIATGERALAIREATLGPDHPDVAASLDILARLHQSTGNREKARGLFDRALVVAEKALGPDHPDVARVLTNAAILDGALGDPARAVSRLERARVVFERELGEDHTNVGQVMLYLGRVRAQQGDHPGAIADFERALAIVAGREDMREIEDEARAGLASSRAATPP